MGSLKRRSTLLGIDGLINGTNNINIRIRIVMNILPKLLLYILSYVLLTTESKLSFKSDNDSELNMFEILFLAIYFKLDIFIIN